MIEVAVMQVLLNNCCMMSTTRNSAKSFTIDRPDLPGAPPTLLHPALASGTAKSLMRNCGRYRLAVCSGESLIVALVALIITAGVLSPTV
jgi:hypothetical protein